MLPKLAHHIDGMLQEAETQQGNLRQAQSKPWVLDDYTVKRVIEVYTTQQNDLALFDEQIRRWKAGQLTPQQRREVERLAGQMQKLHKTIADILAIAAELSKDTIEKQMAKSDEQLGFEQIMRILGGEGKP
jgi:hypothetical protein